MKTHTAVAPADVARTYFDALNRRDTRALDAVYAKDATFDDNVFHHDDSAKIIGMWSKLPKDAFVKSEITGVEGNTVSAKLEWDYTLFGTKVHNSETSQLTVENGKIVRQKEHFDFGTWAHQLAPLVPKSVLSSLEPFLAPILRHVGA